MNPHHHSQTSSYLSASCFILYLSKYSTLQWDICEINSRTLWLGRCSVPPPTRCSSAEEIESDSCGVFELALFSLPAIPCRDGRQQVLLSVESRVTLWCCFGKKKGGLLCCQVAVVGRDSYGFVFPPRVTASAAPFAPLTGDPTPQPNGPHPGSNPCFSHMSMCVFAQALAVFAGPGQSDWLAQMWQA